MDQPVHSFVYILGYADGSYYIGHAENVPHRVQVHNEGRGAQWTAERRPVVLVHQEEWPDELAAIRREIQLKGLSKAKKAALISADNALLKQLSKRRHPARPLSEFSTQQVPPSPD